MKLGSLFSGYGGLDLGVQAALGPMKTAWVSDIEPGPSTILTRRFPDSPNLGDITQIDWTRVEPVDVIAGGSPCQDLSLAGARAGMKPGTRSGLWESMFTAIKTIRPRLVVWENVRGALSAEAFSLMESREGRVGDGPDGPFLWALGRVLGDLASIGYDAQWVGIRASDVGAPHQRYRVFVTAHPAGDMWWLQHRDGTATGDPDRAARDQWGQPAPGEAEGRGARSNACGPDRAPVALLPTPRCDNNENRQSEGYGPNLGAALLPTPTAERYGSNQSTSEGATVRYGLDSIDKLLPTPMANEGEKAAFAPRNDDRQEYLTNTIARLLTTPSVADVEGGRKSRSGERGDELLLNGLAALGRFGEYAPAIHRWETVLGRAAPDPTEMGSGSRRKCEVHGDSKEVRSGKVLHRMREANVSQTVREREVGRSGQAPGGHSASKACTCKRVLSPRFCEWMMGLPEGWVTDIEISRAKQLRALGNGVVPQQAAQAIRALLNVPGYTLAV